MLSLQRVLFVVLAGSCLYLSWSIYEQEHSSSTTEISQGKSVPHNLEDQQDHFRSEKTTEPWTTTRSSNHQTNDLDAEIINTSLSLRPRENKTNCLKWGVLTTIFSIKEAVRRFFFRGDWCMVVVGDVGGPKDFKIHQAAREKMVFLSHSDQIQFAPDFAGAMPNNSFARKNVGYLYAIAMGAEVIWDFDDDNMLKFWLPGASVDPNLDIDQFANLLTNRNQTMPVLKLDSHESIFNPYPMLGCELNPCWPRGLPLTAISNADSTIARAESGEIKADTIAILQSLADHEPDIDAIFRFTKDSKFSFNTPKNITSPLMIPSKAFAPLNAQSSLHSFPGLFALYLPISVPGRVSDIWRGYIAQTLFKIIGLSVGYLPRPLVSQQRNPHSNLKDFEDEILLYTKTEKLLYELEKFMKQSRDSKKNISHLLMDLYKFLVKKDLLGQDDVSGMQQWLQALISSGYLKSEVQSTNDVQTNFMNSLNLNVGSNIFDLNFVDIPNLCENNHVKKRFWISELHLGTTNDLVSQLSFINQTIVVARNFDKIPHFNHSGKIVLLNQQKGISNLLGRFVNSVNDPWEDSDIVDTFKTLRNEPVVQNIDAFVCAFPASMCELWAKFNKSIVFLPAHRYSLGRCDPASFDRLNELLHRLSKNSNKHLIGAMSRYDKEFMSHFVDLPAVSILSSLSGLYLPTTDNFNPTRDEILVFSNVDRSSMLRDYHASLNLSPHNTLKFAEVRDLYPTFAYSDLVQHPAVVYFPYSVMSYKFTEIYALAIPLFVPSPKMVREVLKGLGADRTVTSNYYCRKESTSTFEASRNSHHPYDPNLDFKENPESEMYWLQLSDFYEWPHVQLFDNWDDLVDRVHAADLRQIHQQMKLSYKVREKQTLNQWCEFLPLVL